MNSKIDFLRSTLNNLKKPKRSNELIKCDLIIGDHAHSKI